MKSNIIENISKSISRLPGMGPRVAKRIVLNLACNKEKILNPLIEQLQNLSQKVFNCTICGNIDEGKICAICADTKRDSSIICIVEEVADLWAIERAKNFRGQYHVLGGNLSAMSGNDVEDLNIASLEKRVQNSDLIKEIIIATSSTIDGQTTAHFLLDTLKDINDIKITRLSHGIPLGSELDYLDDGTISVAFKTRMEF